ncbi:hypothetical protein [Azospirillum sp. B4]|uniref:hypothetical protein n=1 Tax=Azospirillum sp. B4 TaxID=95605 RepID=UPI0003471A08|nr:hypothetical protein [Azospirillum sp. B4]
MTSLPTREGTPLDLDDRLPHLAGVTLLSDEDVMAVAGGPEVINEPGQRPPL